MEQRELQTDRERCAQSKREWRIIYTRPKAEKKIFTTLLTKEIASFLPLHYEIRKWSDRKKKLEVPLFPNYIFVNVSPFEQYEPLRINGVIRYVSFNGKPATVPGALITNLNKILQGNVQVSNEKFVEGAQVKISNGPFAGAEGLLVRKNGTSRLVILINALQRSVSVDISADSVVQVS